MNTYIVDENAIISTLETFEVFSQHLSSKIMNVTTKDLTTKEITESLLNWEISGEN